MLDLSYLQSKRQDLLKHLELLNIELLTLYQQYPDIFPKRPEDMSIADKLRFSGELLKFAEAIQK